MGSNYRPQGSEKITDDNAKLERIKVIAGIDQKPIANDNKFNTRISTVLHEAGAADGQTYGLVQEGTKVYIKRLVNEQYVYVTGDEKDYAYKNYAQAFKHMNLLFKDISQRNEFTAPINLFEGGLTEKKKLTKNDTF